MKYTLPAIALGVTLGATSLGNAYAQQANQVRLNLLPLTTGTVAVEYERVLSGGLSAVGMISYRPEGKLPFYSSWNSLIDEQETRDMLADSKQGALSLAVEARYYPGKKGAMRGFYLAPYLKHATYSAGVPLPVEFEPPAESGIENIDEVTLSGDLKTLTAGLGLGVQFSLGKRVSLDWKIIGPGYGSSKGTLIGKADRNLTPSEQEEIRNELDNLEDIPMVKIESKTVNAEGAEMKIKGPWAGIRTGLSIGFKF